MVRNRRWGMVQMDTLGQIRGIRPQETSNFLDIDILQDPRLEELEQEATAAAKAAAATTVEEGRPYKLP